MITSSDDKREQAEAAGVTQLLGKPYSEEALIAAIERARLAEPVLERLRHLLHLLHALLRHP